MGGLKKKEKVKLMEKRILTLAQKGGECRVQGGETNTAVVANSDCWLLKVGVKI